jgi:hypothetical protein
MIPKIAHFFWIANQPMSFMRYMTLYSFRKFNPDWEIKLHLVNMDLSGGKTWDEEVGQDYLTPFTGEDHLSKAFKLGVTVCVHNPVPDALRNIKEPAAASDVWAWYLLATEGGACFDMDILFLEPLESMYQIIKDSDFVIPYGHSTPLCPDNYFSIGSMFAKAPNKIAEDMLDCALRNYSSRGYQSAGVKVIEQLCKTPEELSSIYPDLSITTMPMSTFYPFDWRMLDVLFGHDATTYAERIGIYGIHWYGGSKIAQKYIHKINSANVYGEIGTIFRKMGELLDEH